MIDDAKLLAVIVTVMAVLVTAVIGSGITLDRYHCSQVGEMSGKATKHKLIGGCYVEVNGRFIPKDNWRGEYDQ